MPFTPSAFGLPWQRAAGGPRGASGRCHVGAGRADRPLRERLRQHLLLCAAVDHPALPRPLALTADDQGVQLEETLDGTGWPATLAQQAKAPADPADWLDLARALAGITLVLERCGVVQGPWWPEQIGWEPVQARAWLLDLSEGAFLHAPPAGLLQHPPGPHSNLLALGRLLLWRATGRDELLRAEPEAGVQLGLVGIEALSRLDPFVLAVLRGLLHAGTPAGYRSAQALVDELQRGRTGPRPAALGRPATWCLPQERLGRTGELETLLHAFAAVDGRAAGAPVPGGSRAVMVVVDGRSGVGKTSVVQAACRTLADHGARVAEGKFNQFGNRQPLAALIDALDQALADAAELEGPRRAALALRVAAGLGGLAAALCPSLPWLERLIGPQAAAPELTGEASRTRFELALRRLVAALAGSDEPLVLFVDDLQWADARSLELLAGLLLEPRMSGLLLLGAYRSEAVDARHPLAAWLARLQQTPSTDLRQLTVRPWTRDDVARLLEAAQVGDDAARSRAAQRLVDDAQGNPFATLQRLRCAEQSGALAPDADGQAWVLDLPRLDAMLAGCTTVGLVQSQMARLPAHCQAALCDAAHLGAAWTPDTLAAARGSTPMQTLRDLAPALAAGLLRVMDDAVAPGQPLMLGFLHDVVQQAAHELVGASLRDEVRLRLGRGLLHYARAHGHLDQFLFAIVQQFDGVAVGDPAVLDAESSVQLHERAGQLARAQGASLASLHYFMRAVAACPPQAWTDGSRQAFMLYRQAAEAAYLATRFDVVDELIGLAEAHAPQALEAARFGELRVLVLLARNRLAEALAVGQATLERLGVPLQPLDDPAGWPQVPEAAQLDLSRGSPPVVDTALRLLVGLTPCAFITSFELYARVIRTMTGLAQQWPASPLTPLAWTNYGLTLCGMERPAEAFEASELALGLSARVGDAALDAKVRVLSLGFLRHWQLPLASLLAPMLQAHEDCLVCGDQEYLGYATFLYCDKAYGLEGLDALLEGHTLRAATVQQFGHEFSHRHCQVWLQGLRSLRGDASTRSLHLDGPAFAEAEGLQHLAAAQNGFSLFSAHAWRALLAWHRGDREATWAACEQALPVAANGTGTLLSVDLQVLCALSAPPAQAGAFRDRLAAWAAAAPVNLRHKLDLVDATLAARAGDLQRALLLFERARDAAAAGGFLRDQLMAETGCGEALADAGERPAAQRWLEDAWASGVRWGALAVAECLLARHPWLQARETRSDLEPSLPLEARLRRWLDDCGAQRVALRLVDPPLTLLAERHDGTLRVRLHAVGEDSSAWVPHRLLDEVAQRGGARLLEHPAEHPDWRDDPCLAQHRPALAWACRIGEGPGGGQAYVECAGPRLLMSERALARTQGHVDGIVTSLRARAAEERLARSRHLDASTLLPNRAGFATLVELTLAHTRGRSDHVAVVWLVRPRGQDPRGGGFGEGDGPSPALHETVLRLQQSPRRGLVVGRLAHRLFGVVYIAPPDRGAMLSAARDLLDRLEAPLFQGGRMLFELAACMDSGQGSTAELLDRTEHALARAAEGRSGIAVVDHAEGDAQTLPGSVDLMRDLDWALRHEGLRLVYQPIVDMADNRLISAEALVRWHHPALGEVSPERFVGLAERSGLIRYLGRWVTDAVVRQVAQWRAQGAGPKSVSFNASPLELLQPDYADHLIETLQAAGLSSQDVVLEITESASLQDDESTRGNLAKLHAAGILMCIDDFGVGTSSLGRLHAVLARRLKIDRSFIEGVDRDAGRRTTVTMIIRLAESLALDVVAEGVGRPEEVAFLLSEGLRLGQGYYYARPLEAAVMDRVLQDGALPPVLPA